MSIADLLLRATPEARYYDYDRKIMEDYDNRAKIYSDAFDKYKTDFADYQTKVDDFNLLVDQYNQNLADPAFTGTAPVFKGGGEPTAPADPSFSQGDIDAFIDEATGRATRRGQTAATAFNVLSQGGNFATAPQVQGGAGVGTVPEFSFSATGFENGGEAMTESTERGPINLPGFDNINFLLRGLNLPYNLVAGTGRKTREALDPSLPTEERIRAGGEAAIETGIQAFLPFAGRMAGQPLSRAVVESFFPVSTPKSTTELAADTVEDMGRRNMLKGAAATTGIAALAPEVFIEASKKVPAAVTKTAAKAVPISAINSVAENLKFLRRKNDELRELREETLDQIGPSKEADELNVDIFRNQDQMYNDFYEILDTRLSPEDLKNATNESLEEIVSFRYDADGVGRSIDVPSSQKELEKWADITQEAKSRGLHKAKDENGIDIYPNIETLVDDFNNAFKNTSSVDIIQNIPPTALKMTDDSGKSTEQLVKELTEGAFKSQYEFVKKQLEETTDLSPEQIDRMARINAGRSGRNMAEGGVVSFAPYLR